VRIFYRSLPVRPTVGRHAVTAQTLLHRSCGAGVTKVVDAGLQYMAPQMNPLRNLRKCPFSRADLWDQS
jgi:hypothetical protein